MYRSLIMMLLSVGVLVFLSMADEKYFSGNKPIHIAQSDPGIARAATIQSDKPRLDDVVLFRDNCKPDAIAVISSNCINFDDELIKLNIARSTEDSDKQPWCQQ